jgi:hypothetical protein
MKICFKKSAFAAAIGISSVCFAGAAHAVVVTPSGGTFGVLSADASETFTGYGLGPSKTIADLIGFSVDAAASVDINATAFKVVAAYKDWSSFSISLYDGATLLAGGPGDAVAQSFYNPVTHLTTVDWVADISYLPLTVTGSPYTIHINGVTDSRLGATSKATYAGNLSLSPVPEPETYAMMLAGLGLLGLTARRRNLQARR